MRSFFQRVKQAGVEYGNGGRGNGCVVALLMILVLAAGITFTVVGVV